MNAPLYCSQLQYDNALPEDNDAELAYYDYHAERLLCEEDARGVDWEVFAQAASEAVIDADGSGFLLLLILLALRNGDPATAQNLYTRHFDRVICGCAARLVRQVKVPADED
jgi:hypothetical protein